MKEAVKERPKAFATTHTADEDQQTYISAFQPLSVIAKAKVKASIIHTHEMGKSLDSSAPLRPISLTSCVSKLLNASFHRVYSSFRNLTLFSLPVRPVSAVDGLFSNFVSFSFTLESLN